MARAAFGQQVVHVFKVLYVAALVTGESNALHIFLYGAVHHLVYTAVMAQVYHLGAGALQYAAHNVYGSVVPVEQAGGGYKTYFMRAFIG
jgi:hypothetical protein